MALNGTSLGISLVFGRFTPGLRSGRMRSATAASCARAPPFPRVERWGRSPETWMSFETFPGNNILYYLPLRERWSFWKPLNESSVALVPYLALGPLCMWTKRKFWCGNVCLQNHSRVHSTYIRVPAYITLFNPTWEQSELQVSWLSDCLSIGCEKDLW